MKKAQSRRPHAVTLLSGLFGCIISLTVFGSPIGSALGIYSFIRACKRYANDGEITLMEKTGLIFAIVGIPIGILLPLLVFMS